MYDYAKIASVYKVYILTYLTFDVNRNHGNGAVRDRGLCEVTSLDMQLNLTVLGEPSTATNSD